MTTNQINNSGPREFSQFAKVVEDAVLLFEHGMEAEHFLRFIQSGDTDLMQWAKINEPCFYRATRRANA